MRVGRIGDRADRIVDELRIAAVLLGVRDDQRELGGEVLEVVHHERGQTMVGLELPALGQLAVGLVLREVRRDVPPDGLAAGRDPRR